MTVATRLLSGLRRGWIGLAALMIGLVGCGVGSREVDSGGSKVRIGYQKAGTLNLMRLRGSLEPDLKRLGVEVEWIGFPAGPQLLEAMNSGSVDFGHTGDAPPILAQAAGVAFVYVAHEPARPHAEAILVPSDSPLRTLADLKGRKVALNKGSNVHFFLIRALESVGVGYDQIQPVFLPPSDARAAFDGRSVDAWATWDPYFAEAELNTGARILADGEGLVANREFFLAARDAVRTRPEVIRSIVEALGREGDWARANLGEVSRILGEETGLKIETMRRVTGRKGYGIALMDDSIVAEQQRVADVFATLGLIPRKIDIRDVIVDAFHSIPGSPKN
jgi:sulfonate transport system substrate-binding protein